MSGKHFCTCRHDDGVHLLASATLEGFLRSGKKLTWPCLVSGCRCNDFEHDLFDPEDTEGSAIRMGYADARRKRIYTEATI